MAIEATIVVQFGENADQDALAILELDDDVNIEVDDEGETQIITQFEPGYQPVFLFHFDVNKLRISKKPLCSAGEVQLISPVLTKDTIPTISGINGGIIKQRTQQLSFIKETPTSEKAQTELTYIMYRPRLDIVEQTWYKDPSVPLSEVGKDWEIVGRTVTITDSIPRIVDLTYKVHFQQYRFYPPPMTLAEDETFPVLIVFYMDKAL